MHRTVAPSSPPARALACLWLLAAAPAAPALAATVCADTVAEVRAALAAADQEEQTINVVTGSYQFGTAGLDVLAEHDVRIVGGWNAGCAARQPDPRLTVFTAAAQKRFDILSHESLGIESIAFIGAGRVVLNGGWPGGGGGSDLSLDRVWFQDLCAGGAPCDDVFDSENAIGLGAEYIRLSHVVVADAGAPGCAARISASGLSEVAVLFSLVTGSAGDGLCLGHDAGDPNDEYTMLLQNSLLWNNAGDDLVTRESPLITLRNNVYQSWDANPPSSVTGAQNLQVDPQFQNAAGHDYRLQPSSPAVNTGRIGALALMPEQDLDGGARVIGPAPDRGPIESPSTESTFQVVNTLDALAPVATGSLRWAIEQANATPGLDRIRFALPGCPRIIELSAPLPDVTDSVVIDGYSQAGSAKNASSLGFAPTLCVGLRDAALTLDHALRIPAGAPDDTLLWVSGLAFGGFDVAAVRIAAGSNSWIFGNQFGGSLGGTALGNNAVNVRLGGTSHDNLVGGLEVSQRNLIGAAYSAGVELLDNSAGDEGYGNTVRNNLIGLQGNGQDAAPNALGIRVRSLRNTIEDNTISGNQGDGILLEGAFAFRNQIRANAIGRKTFAFCLPPCTPDYALGNAGAGVRLVGDGTDNRIQANRIQFNGGAGVQLEAGLRNFVWDNSIGGNGALGIDVGATGANPVYNTGLVVTGTYANRGVNAPLLTEASGDGSGGSVRGQLAARNGLHRVQVFRNASCDASGRGEGTTLLHTGTVTVSNAAPGANGSASFTFPLPVNVDVEGTQLTATATDGDGNSSEFSACLAYQTLLCRELFKDGLEDNPPPPQCTPP